MLVHWINSLYLVVWTQRFHQRLEMFLLCRKTGRNFCIQLCEGSLAILLFSVFQRAGTAHEAVVLQCQRSDHAAQTLLVCLKADGSLSGSSSLCEFQPCCTQDSSVSWTWRGAGIFTYEGSRGRAWYNTTRLQGSQGTLSSREQRADPVTQIVSVVFPEAVKDKDRMEGPRDREGRWYIFKLFFFLARKKGQFIPASYLELLKGVLLSTDLKVHWIKTAYVDQGEVY